MSDYERKLKELRWKLEMQERSLAEKQSNTTVASMISFAIGFLCLAGIAFAINGEIAMVLILYLLAIIIAIAKGRIGKKEERTIEELKKQIKENETRMYKEGCWKFPSEEFHQKCIKNGVVDLDSSFNMRKAKNFAVALMTDKKVPSSFQHFYISDEQIREYFYGAAREEEDRKKAKEERDKRPYQGRPNGEERRDIELNRRLVRERGFRKREAILLAQIQGLKQVLAEAEEGGKAARDMSLAVARSAYQEKTTSWATMGGIADALGGPGAGVSAAVDTMVRNKEIEARNAQNKAYATNMAYEISHMGYNLRQKAEAMHNRVNGLEKEIKDLRLKIVLDNVKSDALKGKLQVTKKCIQKTDSNILKIELDLRNTYVPNVPAGNRIVVDGTMVAEVSVGETVVGEANICLPLYGVECGKSGTATGYCEWYMEGNPTYTVNIKKYNLWAMEL